MNKPIDTFFHEALGRWIAGWDWNQPVEEGRPSEDDISTRLWMWSELSDACQSPIEQILLTELLFITNGYHQITSQTGYHNGEFCTFLNCQEDVIGYRVDFLLTVREGDFKRTLIIECDGHDFHEKTKEQAKGDKSRDRALVAAGHTVIRFTGSEIYNNPHKCAEETEDVLSNLAEEIAGSPYKKRRDAPRFSNTSVL